MKNIIRWGLYIAVFFVITFLGGCATRGVVLVDSAKRVTTVPTIGQNFNRIPLRVAVYIAPQVFESHAIYDDHTNSMYPYVQDYASIGTDVAVTTYHYAPLAFNESYMVSSFPDPRLLHKDIDVVLVIEHVADSVWYSSPSTFGWDVSLTAGLYTPEGFLVKRYSVVATYAPSMPFFSGPNPAFARWAIQQSHKSVAPAVRLLLQQFPRQYVLQYIQTHHVSAHEGAHLASEGALFWQLQRQVFAQGVSEDKPVLAKPDITVTQYVQKANKIFANTMALANQLTTASTRNDALRYANNPSAFNQRMLEMGMVNQAVSQALLQQYQDIAAGKDPSTTPFLFRFLGGLSSATQTAASAMPMTGAMGSNQGINDTRVGQVCQANVNRLSSSLKQNESERQTTCLYYCYYTATHSQQLYANYLTAQKYANDLCDGRVSATCNTITNIDSKCGYR